MFIQVLSPVLPWIIIIIIIIMVIYKAPVSAASNAHDASPHNNQNNILKSWAYMKPRARMYQTVWLKRWVFIAHMFQASHKQWEVAILILIKSSTSIKFRIVEMDDWLNLNKRPCWDSIRDPFTSEANPWSAGLCYLNHRVCYWYCHLFPKI